MSLYVRLQTSFWTHRKTLRLRALIGNDALWLPQRLWSYAAETQPDGDFSDYSAGELALCLGYAGDATAMLEALQRVGFMAGMKIHAWEEHNGFHVVFSERARKAADARWKSFRSTKARSVKKKRHEMIRQETSIATSNAQAMQQALLVNPSSEDIYMAYPRHDDRKCALKAIEKAMKLRAPQFLLDRTIVYAMTQPPNDQFTPLAATWFNKARYDDDPATWAPRSGAARAVTARPEKPKHELKDDCKAWLLAVHVELCAELHLWTKLDAVAMRDKIGALRFWEDVPFLLQQEWLKHKKKKSAA